MPIKNWPIVPVRLSQAVINQLDTISKETGKNRSDLIREAVSSFIGMYLNATRKTREK